MSKRCNCATFGNAHFCTFHTQEDFEAANAVSTDEAAQLLKYSRRRGFTFGSVLGHDVAEAIWQLVDEHDALHIRIGDKRALDMILTEVFTKVPLHSVMSIRQRRELITEATDAIVAYLIGPELPAQESRLSDLYGLDPNFTGGMSTSDYLRHIRGENNGETT